MGLGVKILEHLPTYKQRATTSEQRMKRNQKTQWSACVCVCVCVRVRVCVCVRVYVCTCTCVRTQRRARSVETIKKGLIMEFFIKLRIL